MKGELVVSRDGAKVCRRLNRIVVWAPDGEMLASTPAFQVSRLVIAGSVSVTSQTLTFLLRQKVPVTFIDSLGRPQGTLSPHPDRTLYPQFRQLRAADDPAQCLDLGRRIVVGKIHNQAALLSRRGHWDRSPELRRVARRLRNNSHQAERAESLPELLGHEGAASADYFGALKPLLSTGGFVRRDRSAPDVANALINYCAGVLRETIRTAVIRTGLHPGLGFLHQSGPARPSLVFDLMEEWRPVLVEGVVIPLLGLRRVTGDDMERRFGQHQLTSEARRKAVDRIHQRLASTRQPEGRTLGEIVNAQPLALSHHLSGGPGYETFRWK